MIYKTILLLLFVLFFQPCFAEMAQEVIIPGYQPTDSSLPVTTPAPVVSTHPNINPAPPLPASKPTLIPATEEELQALIQSVDLSYWSGFASYLWTCTPRYYTMPMYSAKNDIQAKFNEFKVKKKILTLEQAKQITATLAKPMDYKVPGLKGIDCNLNIIITNVEKPYQLTCYFIMLDARYLSQLAMSVAANSGKPEVLPADILNAIQKLLDANCTKTNLTT